MAQTDDLTPYSKSFSDLLRSLRLNPYVRPSETDPERLLPSPIGRHTVSKTQDIMVALLGDGFGFGSSELGLGLEVAAGNWFDGRTR